MKKRLFGVLATISALTIAFAIAVMVIAVTQDEADSELNPVAERIAHTLGIRSEEASDESAYTVEELRKRYADALVDEGRINEMDARGFEQWLADAPEIFRADRLGRDFERLESFGRAPLDRFRDDSERGFEWLEKFGERGWEKDDDFEDLLEQLEVIPEILPLDQWREKRGSEENLELEPFATEGWFGELVEEGLLSEEGLERFEFWFKDLADSFERGTPGGRDFEFESDDGRFRFRWHWNRSDDDEFFELHPETDKDANNGI
jgi:hypothetical protein